MQFSIEALNNQLIKDYPVRSIKNRRFFKYKTSNQPSQPQFQNKQLLIREKQKIYTPLHRQIHTSNDRSNNSSTSLLEETIQKKLDIKEKIKNRFKEDLTKFVKKKTKGRIQENYQSLRVRKNYLQNFQITNDPADVCVKGRSFSKNHEQLLIIRQTSSSLFEERRKNIPLKGKIQYKRSQNCIFKRLEDKKNPKKAVKKIVDEIKTSSYNQIHKRRSQISQYEKGDKIEPWAWKNNMPSNEQEDDVIIF